MQNLHANRNKNIFLRYAFFQFHGRRQKKIVKHVWKIDKQNTRVSSLLYNPQSKRSAPSRVPPHNTPARVSRIQETLSRPKFEVTVFAGVTAAAGLRGALASETAHSTSLFLAIVQTHSRSAAVFSGIKAKELVFTSGTLLEYLSRITPKLRHNTYASVARSLPNQPSSTDHDS